MELLPVLGYLVALGALTALGAPVAALGFRALPRRGAAFALPTALVPLAIVVFWVGQVTFGLHTVLLGVVVLGVGAVVAHRLGGRPEWRAVAGAYGVFALGFVTLLLFRASSPSITPAGGEQFLHFALVKSLARAPALPPEDVWFAGEPIRYYYGTQLQVTSLSLLTGTPLRYGFNLGIATFYGVLVVVAYGLSGALVSHRSVPRRFGGVLGVLFVAVAGPTTTAIRMVTPHLPDPLRGVVAQAAFGFVAQRFYGGDLARAVAERTDPLLWSWWFTRYVVPGTLHEVPLYSFVKADLHGHALSTGYVLFAGAVAYAYGRTPAEDRARRVALLVGGLGAIAGVFGFMNTWALPTAAGLALLAAGAADAHPATLLPDPWGSRLAVAASPDERLRWAAAECWRLALAAVAALVVGVVGVAIAAPFLVFGHVPSNEGIGLLPPRSPLGPFLVVYAGLLAMFAAAVVARGWPAVAGVDRWKLGVGGVALLGTMAALVLWLEFAVLAVTGPLLLGAWLLVRTERGGFALVLFVAGVGLLLSLELVHARLPEIGHPRWNTSLKVAVQGWTLAAAGAGATAATLLVRSRERLGAARPVPDDRGSDAGDTSSADRRARLAAGAALALVALVLATSLLFPVFVFGQEVVSDAIEGQYNGTLDGRHRLERERPGEAAALAWLDDRRGTPTIVEAPGGSYRWTSPASTFTGLPTVVGWDHQAEYRSPAAYERRVRQVDAIYTGNWSAAAAALDRHDVRYVYVGPSERERYGGALRAFDRAAFTVAFESETVTVYAVRESRLSARQQTLALQR